MNKKAQKEAEKLINEFGEYSHSDWNIKLGFNNEQRIENAKQCALICVNKIQDELRKTFLYGDKERAFYRDVEKAIKNHKEDEQDSKS